MKLKKDQGNLILEENGQSYIRLSALYEAELKPAIMAPFYGVYNPVILRRLTYTQIRACGDFSLIETVTDMIANKKKKLSDKEMVAYSELQYEIIKRSLVSPTYDEIMGLNENDELRISSEKELIELEEIIKDLPSGPKKQRIQMELNVLKMNSQFLLPPDFVSFVLSFALQLDDSDIKDISEDMLYEAALRAKGGSGNPSDHLPGNFTEFNKVDINNRALIIYHRRTAENGNTR